MSEAIALALLQILVTAFPPLAQLFARYLPDDDSDPLVEKVKAILPADGASAAARRTLEINTLDDPED